MGGRAPHGPHPPAGPAPHRRSGRREARRGEGPTPRRPRRGAGGGDGRPATGGFRSLAAVAGQTSRRPMPGPRPRARGARSGGAPRAGTGSGRGGLGIGPTVRSPDPPPEVLNLHGDLFRATIHVALCADVTHVFATPMAVWVIHTWTIKTIDCPTQTVIFRPTISIVSVGMA